jgi:hypothetical protein
MCAPATRIRAPMTGLESEPGHPGLADAGAAWEHTAALNGSELRHWFDPSIAHQHFCR